MSAPGRRMDSPKCAGMDACVALCVPSGFVRSIVLRVAHMVDTHSCRPGFRPSHIVLFTGRSAQSLLATESLSASPFCGPHAAVSVRETTRSSSGLAGGVTGGGEVLVGGAGEGVRQAAGRLFYRLQSRYAQQRAGWLAGWLERELLGDLLIDLRRGAEVPEGVEFREVEAIAGLLIDDSQSPTPRGPTGAVPGTTRGKTNGS